MSRGTTPVPTSRARPVQRLLLGVVALFLLIASLIGLQQVSPEPGASQTALDPEKLPGMAEVEDSTPVELGLTFSATVDGTVNEIRFYKGSAENTGPHVGSLWSSSGQLLAQTTFTNETTNGWQTAALPTAVPVLSGRTYVVSYFAPSGRYAADYDTFSTPHTRGNLTIPAAAGVYNDGSTAFPTSSYRNSNYYVDVTFTPAATAGSPATDPRVQPGATVSGTLREVDGGSNYYARFADSLPSDPSFFPVGVWFESITDEGNVELDRRAGINVYVELTADSDTSLLSPDGPYAITSADMPGIAGRITTDEADMWAGPGDAPWTGNYPGQGPICSPDGTPCGYTVMKTMRNGIGHDTLAYTNYGKGVTFWESDAEAARFVNGYQDVVSADNYWFTDPNICGAHEGGKIHDGRALTQDECRLAANYGWTVDRLRSLVQPAGSQPVWAFVEVGHPAGENTAPTITGPEIRAAVWSSVIHGARGVVYFNHSFGGDCLSQHVLREACGSSVRPTVTAVNKQLARLAPILNAPFLDGVTSTNNAVDHMTKLHDGQVYVFAGSTQHPSQTVTLDNACVGDGPVTVVGENRTLVATGGRFVDGFADGNAVHIYQAPATSSCLK